MASAHSIAAVSVLDAASKQATLPSSSSSSSALYPLSSLRSKPRQQLLSLRSVALKGIFSSFSLFIWNTSCFS